jgi:hypothetical protein
MTVWTHIGNVQDWGITPSPTVIKHKNTQGGLKRVDLVAMTLMEMAFATKLDEWTLDNITMALLGASGTDTTGALTYIGVNVVQRQMKFVGANQYGPGFEVIMPSCFINAKDTLQFLGSDDFASIPLSGDILLDASLGPNGAFGTVRSLTGATGSAPVATPNELNYYLGTGSVYTAPVA